MRLSPSHTRNARLNHRRLSNAQTGGPSSDGQVVVSGDQRRYVEEYALPYIKTNLCAFRASGNNSLAINWKSLGDEVSITQEKNTRS
jgi:hypothetical protein